MRTQDKVNWINGIYPVVVGIVLVAILVMVVIIPVAAKFEKILSPLCK